MQDATLLDNIRLWDLRAYNATITQIQALRPYYTFPDTDVDRYFINGRIKQVLLSPREIDVNQLSAEASQSWINPRFIYTHGFGVVVSEVNKITPDGLPNLADRKRSAGNQIARISAHSAGDLLRRKHARSCVRSYRPRGVRLSFRRPEQVFDISGHGRFSCRLFAAENRRCDIPGRAEYHFHRLSDRAEPDDDLSQCEGSIGASGGFLQWDPDPYLVMTDDGRLVWMVDGYTTSLSHPYSATIPVTGLDDGANYIRNAVKATVDAYTGKYLCTYSIRATPSSRLSRSCFRSCSGPLLKCPPTCAGMPAIRRFFFARRRRLTVFFICAIRRCSTTRKTYGRLRIPCRASRDNPTPMQPTYVVATLPGEKEPEFLLILPFTPRGKDNLIGWMAARCDGDQLGNLVYFQLSKQQLMYGPMQIESRIDQDQNISKDLTLWNQQGSRVLRGNVIALPVTGGFLYVESIYIQANEARMPQVKKVVLAMGDRLIYRDTFEEALAELTGTPAPSQPAAPTVCVQIRPAQVGHEQTCQRSPNASAAFENRPNNWLESWRLWKKRLGRNSF